MKVPKFVLLCLLIFTISCSQSNEPEAPDWVEYLIEEFESQDVGNPPYSIWEYQYKNQVVYFIPAQCCDQFSSLFDKNGNIICAPDGGFSGRGDDKCSDFFSERSNGKLIWKDTRTNLN